MSVNVKKLKLTELVALKYNLAVDLYRQRAKALEADAASKKEWVPFFAYKVLAQFPSIGLFLNPYWSVDPSVRQFSNSKIPGLYSALPVPPNRTRQRTVGFKANLGSVYNVFGVINGTELKWTGNGWDFPSKPTEFFPTNGTYRYAIATRWPIVDFIKDTTWKSRNPNSGKIPRDLKDRLAQGLNGLGECESISWRFESPSNSVSWNTFDHSWNDFWDSRLVTDISGSYSVAYEHGSATVDPSTCVSSAGAERSYAMDMMANNIDTLVARCLPSRRSYNAFYQLGELKDMPQLLHSSIAAWHDVESLMGTRNFVEAFRKPSFWTRQNILSYKDVLSKCHVYLDADMAIASAYLTFKFGWQSIYQAAEQLAKAPERITKQINYLLRLNGRDATLSTIMHLPDGEWPSHPAITPYVAYPLLPDPDDPISVISSRKASIRCVVNCGIRLPDISVPKLRENLYLDKLGLIPRPSDIYDLIPWTWLFDWFIGLRGYLQLVEEVQGDKELINWGLATFRSELWARSSIGGFMLYNKSFIHNASNSVHDLTVAKATMRGEGTLQASYKLRVGIQTLAQVKLASGYRLSDGQKAILTALVSTRSVTVRKS